MSLDQKAETAPPNLNNLPTAFGGSPGEETIRPSDHDTASLASTTHSNNNKHHHRHDKHNNKKSSMNASTTSNSNNPQQQQHQGHRAGGTGTGTANTPAIKKSSGTAGDAFASTVVSAFSKGPRLRRSTTSKDAGNHSRSNSDIEFHASQSQTYLSQTSNGKNSNNNGSSSNLASPRYTMNNTGNNTGNNNNHNASVAQTMPSRNSSSQNINNSGNNNGNNGDNNNNNNYSNIGSRVASVFSNALNTKDFADKSIQTFVMAIVVAILIVILVLWVSVSMWVLIEPYSFPLCGACILSVALHEPPTHSHDPSKRYPIAQSIVGAKERFLLYSPRLGRYLSPLVAIPEFFFYSLQAAVIRFGVDKYPGIKVMHEHIQNILFFVMLCALVARLSSFFFPSLLVGMLVSSAVLGGFPILIAFFLCWFMEEQKFVRTMKLLLTTLIVVVISLLFSISIVDEFNQGGRQTVKMIQNLGINIPDNAAEVASSYILSQNTTQRLMPALREFQFNGTWDEIYNNTKLFLTNHTTTLSAALEESQPVAKGVGGALTNIVKLILTVLFWSFGKLYEVILFYMTLTMFLSLDRTVLYYCLKKVLTVVFGDEAKAKIEAEKTEGRMIGELSTLFASLWHLFVFHFLSTLVWYSVFDMPFSVTVSTVGGMLALFPLSLPPMVTQIIIALIVMAIRKSFQMEMLATGIVFWVASMSIDLIVVSKKERPRHKSSNNNLKRSGSTKDISLTMSALDRCISAAQSNIARKEQPFEKASAFLITTSIVLGLTAYGPVGVVIGPVIFIVAHALWDAF